jgi:hypothetical protein
MVSMAKCIPANGGPRKWSDMVRMFLPSSPKAHTSTATGITLILMADFVQGLDASKLIIAEAVRLLPPLFHSHRKPGVYRSSPLPSADHLHLLLTLLCNSAFDRLQPLLLLTTSACPCSFLWPCCTHCIVDLVVHRSRLRFRASILRVK